ncbi:hypothetical protein BCR32DRAFT_250084 [Anaeromyces robustus]|uniref:MULE transposase domain-containing protein n=1 Tax=Anaeromyces robustus TaxID=1754192 RepID=A0A1Y1WEP3_9FUNG|nr:hypothetical protein BCR32DRAFT_250084 [Anaeromyces robustus]|eukprot:ORX71716.1 hypothetical protein BCR32DRAFT_250084 [Anaeromyces robustus]
MEENIEIEISETNRGNEQIIINRKYKFNLSSKRKDNSKIYKCTEYKTMNRCKSFIILNDKYEILKYDSSHNHLEKKYEATTSLVKHKIKYEIRRSSVPFDIKPKRLYDEISPEMGSQCCQYKTIKSSIARNITELFSKYEDIFADGTFYTAPAIAQQVFITRTYIEELNSFYTTSFSIIKNKEQINYEILLEELKKNAIKYNSNNEITPKYFHCDFEKAISNAAEKVFPNINIKYCIWHYKRALKNKFNKLCSKEVISNNDLNNDYKHISNFPFINPDYIYDIYNRIKSKCKEHNYVQFLEFLEYFYYTYLIDYNIKNWNYYNNIKHITNNASESYNNQLKSIFSKKPTFFKLIYVLQKQEFLSNIDYQRRIAGYWEKKPKKLIRTDEINAIVKYYKNMEILEKRKNEIDRKKIINLWLDCLDDLNIKIIN